MVTVGLYMFHGTMTRHRTNLRSPHNQDAHVRSTSGITQGNRTIGVLIGSDIRQPLREESGDVHVERRSA